MSLAFWCLFAGGLLPVAIVFIAKADPDLDVHNPRDVHLTQTGLRKRAYGAHLNGLEAFPLFAAAVITATLRGVPQTWLDIAACIWLVVRVLYTAAYLADLAPIRPVLWALSVLVSATIFLLPD
ncbi:MAPEG family protein [Bradyrhizobium sp.]|uniref:MAPEG family protein n=1 Tax=Bradyrhizobium sp. TaxID=376 RepID=UPI000AE15FF0|nr:MAPEG family protein [Bradyrhizobium sp.]